jgi:Rieske Fe-S protein
MKLKQFLLTRRDALNGIAGAGVVSLTMVAGETTIGYLAGVEVPDPRLVVLRKDALRALREQKCVLVPYGSRAVILFELPSSELRALSAVCTHGQCNVRYRSDQRDIYGACPRGRFTLDGANVPGTPPPRPLRRFAVTPQQNGTLMIRAVTESGGVGSSMDSGAR